MRVSCGRLSATGAVSAVPCWATGAWACAGSVRVANASAPRSREMRCMTASEAGWPSWAGSRLPAHDDSTCLRLCRQIRIVGLTQDLPTTVSLPLPHEEVLADVVHGFARLRCQRLLIRARLDAEVARDLDVVGGELERRDLRRREHLGVALVDLGAPVHGFRVRR